MKKFLLILIPLLLSTWGNAQEGCLGTHPAYTSSFPAATFVPTCSGHHEIIITSGRTGSYSKVQLTAGNTYIFSSTVATDFITIGNENGTQVLATGTEEVTYLSATDQVVRFYTHADENCTYELQTFRVRMVQCGDIQPPVENDDCVDAIPLANGDSSSGTTAIATNSGGYASGDVFYSYTGTGLEKVTVSLCGSDYDTYLRVYTDCDLMQMVGHDYDSCSDGNSELSFYSEGNHTYYIMVEGIVDEVGNYSISLSTEQADMPENCGDHTVSLENITDGFSFLYDTYIDIPVGENALIINGMQIATIEQGTTFSSTLHSSEIGFPGEEIETVQAEIVSHEVFADIMGLNLINYTIEFDTPLELDPNTIYWLRVQSNALGWLNSLEEEDMVGRPGVLFDSDDDTWEVITGEFMYTLDCEEIINTIEGCLDSPNGLNPSQVFVPTCSGHFESVIISGQSGQYSNVQLTAGNTYIFSSSVDTDFITIGNQDGTIVLASGTGSVTYTSTENQIVRFYTHLDENCNSDFLVTFRNRMVQCGDIQPPVENDECVNAIPLACGESSSGSTAIATDSGGYPYPDVFYSYTGSGEEEIITVSLCGSDYSTYLRIYTDCDLTNNYAYNNDFCGEQSQVSFVSDGTTTYYIMIEGFDGFIGGTDFMGDYEISLTCNPMPEAPENCDDHEVLDNNLEDGYFFEYRTFADIPVGENEMIIEGMELSAFFAGTYFDVKLFTNENSLPGTEIASTTTEILSSEVYGDIEGFEFLNYVLEFDQPLTLAPNNDYWLEVKSDAGGWVITTDPASRIGRFGMVHDGVSYVAPGGEFVYKLICDETMNANDLEKFNFAYYPNPANDVLNFKSDNSIQSVSVYNLAGQKVISNAKISNNQMNLSSIPTGNYVFRVELENGQIETFKIVKK